MIHTWKNSKRMPSLQNLSSKDLKVGVFLNKVGSFLKAIKCLNYTNSSELHFTEDRMYIYADVSSTFQARVSFSKEFFQSYVLNEKEVSFAIDIRKIIDFATTLNDENIIKFKLFFYGDHHPAVFTFTEYSDAAEAQKDDDTGGGNATHFFSEGTIHTEFFAKIKHLSDRSNSRHHDEGEAVSSTLVGNACEFLQMFIDLDRGVESLRISISKKEFKMETLGLKSLSTEIIVDSCDNLVFTRFEVNKNSRFKYRHSCFKKMLQTMKFTNKVYLKVLSSGVMKVQCLKTDDKETDLKLIAPICIEFVLFPTVDFEDDDMSERLHFK